MIAVYEWRDERGEIIGCGTQLEVIDRKEREMIRIFVRGSVYSTGVASFASLDRAGEFIETKSGIYAYPLVALNDEDADITADCCEAFAESY